MIFFYDITRFIARLDENTPTGIDRVDIHYAKSILDSKKEIYYLTIIKGVFCAVEKKYGDSIVKYLYDKWILSKKVSFQKKTLSINDASKVPLIKKTIGRFAKCIDKNVFELITKKPNGCYVNISHYGVGKVEAYYVFKTLGKMKLIFFLHDLIPIDFPEHVNEPDEEQHKIRVKAMALFADIIIVNSQFTQKRLYNFCDKQNITRPKCLINKIGIEDRFLDVDISNKPIVQGDYFIYVSTIESRKNHILLLNVWRDMIEKNKLASIPKLIFVGKNGWKNDSAMYMMNRCPYLQNHVFHLQGLSDNELIQLVANSTALLFPSFTEGWGMPLVEAIELNTPVICSAIEIFHEAGKDLLTYVPLIESLGWQNEILKFASDKRYRASKIEKMKAYKMPRWDTHFETFYNYLSEKSSNYNKTVTQEMVENFRASLVVSNKANADKAIDAVTIDKRMRRSKLIRKFKTDPVKFFMDSKNPILRFIGKRLQKLN